ncbi:MAG TPA: dihydroorotate dehydrogenase electron transfer subunit [Candidatus Aphodovivens avistercoris]|nr:dihydroorotate dehydrogenase electron transfer subunit [Candidatus Aphodovivens avistercoris]
MALFDETARILENRQVGPRLWLLRLAAPQLAAAIRPGQFVHMRVPRMEAHILRRPFSVYAADADAGEVEILYQVVGFGTDHMTALEPGEECALLGPVGAVWNPPARGRCLLVGGGVGAAPLFMLCQQIAASEAQADVVLGAQTEAALVCRERYAEVLGAEPACATDDGTYGRAGFCTSLVEEALAAAQKEGAPYDYVAVCGPEPLMKIVAGLAEAADVRCEVSMEKRMACGIGACLSCVVNTVDGKKRACVDGPVFDARKVVW